MRKLLHVILYPDRDGPWYEDAFTDQAVRQATAKAGKTLPDLIEVEKSRHASGWLVNVYELQESG